LKRLGIVETIACHDFNTVVGLCCWDRDSTTTASYDSSRLKLL
jgi:hypothetical protein